MANVNQLYAVCEEAFKTMSDNHQHMTELTNTCDFKKERIERYQNTIDKMEIKIKLINNKIRLSKMQNIPTENLEKELHDVKSSIKLWYNLLRDSSIAHSDAIVEKNCSKEAYKRSFEHFQEKHKELIAMLENDECNDLPQKLQKYRYGDDFFWTHIWSNDCAKDHPYFQYLYQDAEQYPDYPEDHIHHYSHFFEYDDVEVVQSFLDNFKSHYRQLLGDDAGKIFH